MTDPPDVPRARRALVPRAAVGPVLAVLAAVLLAACSPSAGPDPSPSEPTQPEPTVSETEPEPDPWVSLITTASSDSVEVFDAPDSAQPSFTVTAAEAVSYPDATPVTFLVLDDETHAGEADADDNEPADATEPRLRVLLPGPVDADTDAAATPDSPLVLPTGWVRESDVTVATTDYRIEVRLSEQRLVLHRADDVVLDTPVRLGPATPRPGRTFLTELVTPPATDGPYGAYAYALAGYPTALVGFGSVTGVVGIHGGAEVADDAGSPDASTAAPDTEPGSIGIADAEVTRLVEELGLPLGTPVDVVA